MFLFPCKLDRFKNRLDYPIVFNILDSIHFEVQLSEGSYCFFYGCSRTYIPFISHFF